MRSLTGQVGAMSCRRLVRLRVELRGIPVRPVAISCAVLTASSIVALSACGSSSSATTTPATSSSAAAPSSSSAAPVASPPTAAQLQKVVLQLADLPGTWTGVAHAADPSQAANSATGAACAGVKNTYPDRVASVDSQDFTQGASLSVSSNATSLTPAADVASDVAALSNPKYSECLKAVYKASLEADGTVTAADLKVTPGSAGGPSNIAGIAAGSFTLSASGQKQTLYVTSVYITGPSLEAEIDIQSDSPISTALVSGLAAKVAARASAVA
jgi:hypothetical protein